MPHLFNPGVGIVELCQWNYIFDDSTEAGEALGWDPAKVLPGKSAEKVRELKLVELKHGRLAMLAIVGMFVQFSQFGTLSPIVSR